MRVLIIEDENALAEILKEYLLQSHFEVEVLNSGKSAVECILSQAWDLVLLDLMLPEKDGLTICSEVRKHSQVPIIMLTARVEEVDRLLGLRLGADDYVCKPYSPREVVARVEAVLRRSTRSSHPKDSSTELRADAEMLEAHYKGGKAELTLVEFNIMNALLSSPIRIHSRNDLMDAAYLDHRVVNDRTIDSHINKLRKKLKNLTGQDIIRSVYGAGYRIDFPA